MTYEGASGDVLAPYFNHRFKPLQALSIFGRDAKQVPRISPTFAVWYAWKDRELSAFVVGRVGVWPCAFAFHGFTFWHTTRPCQPGPPPGPPPGSCHRRKRQRISGPSCFHFDHARHFVARLFFFQVQLALSESADMGLECLLSNPARALTFCVLGLLS